MRTVCRHQEDTVNGIDAGFQNLPKKLPYAYYAENIKKKNAPQAVDLIINTNP